MLLLGCCSGGWEGSVAVGVCGGGMLWGGRVFGWDYLSYFCSLFMFSLANWVHVYTPTTIWTD